MIVLRMRQLLQRGGDAVPDAALAPPLLLLHHRGQQWGVQEEEEGGEDMESYLVARFSFFPLSDLQ